MIGIWDITEKDSRTGEVLNTQRVKNVITNAMYPMFASALSNGESGSEKIFNALLNNQTRGVYLQRHRAWGALGTSGATPQKTDTNLGARVEATVKRVESVTRIDRNVIYFVEWDSDYPEGTYREAGIWDGGATTLFGSATMINHVRFNQPVVKGPWTIVQIKVAVLPWQETRSDQENVSADLTLRQLTNEFQAEGIIRQETYQDLLGYLTARHSATRSLFSDFSVDHWETLEAVFEVGQDSEILIGIFTVRHSDSEELFSDFTLNP